MSKLIIITNSEVPESASVMMFTNIYKTTLGEDVFVGPFCELGGCKIGARSKISSHTYICPGVTIGEDCFIGHNVSFTNDKFADVPVFDRIEELADKWHMRPTVVGSRVRIGSGCVILPVTIGDDAIIGAGAVVTRDVEAGTTVAGNPARVMRKHIEREPEEDVEPSSPGGFDM